MQRIIEKDWQVYIRMDVSSPSPLLTEVLQIYVYT